MPRNRGVGPRLRERLLLLGYKRPDGEPDVRRFSFTHGFDKTLVYEWLGDRRTPTKELDRLCQILEVSRGWLLYGEDSRPTVLRALVWIVAVLGATTLGMVPSHSEAAKSTTGRLLSPDTTYYVALLVNWLKSRRWTLQDVGRAFPGLTTCAQ